MGVQNYVYVYFMLFKILKIAKQNSISTPKIKTIVVDEFSNWLLLVGFGKSSNISIIS